MMNARIIAVLAALMLTSQTAAQVAPLTRVELREFREDSGTYRSYPSQPITAWEQEFRRELVGGASVYAAAGRLAPRYGLAPLQMRNLAQLWLTVKLRRYRPDRDEATNAELRRRLLGVLAESPRTALVLQAVAESLGGLRECNDSDFQAMIAGSGDPAADAWTIADVAPCGLNYLRAAATAPNRAMPALIRLADYGSLKLGTRCLSTNG